MNYFILMLVLIIGFVFGFIVGFLLLISQLKREQRIKKPDNNENEEKEDIEVESQEKADTSFKGRMLDMEDSWSDMNCTLDDIPKEEYIKENRGKQDKAYNYKK